MFDHIFENRDKKVTNLIKLSDYLGRSLRENIEIFSIDDTEKRVTFITESGKIIAGSYVFDKSIGLNNIQVESGDLFEDSEQFDEFVDYKISNFIQNIFEEDFVEADTSFNKVLQLWESRVKFSSVKKKLYEKSQKFNGISRIIDSEEFQRLVEIAPQLVSFLRENTSLVNIPEIKNMIRLSSSVSQAFDLPKISFNDLHESRYEIPENINHTIYEMICKQELVRKELVESKNNFDLVWLNNEKISYLASLIYEEKEEVIAKALVEAICEVPYLALATKKQITDTLTNNLELNESIRVNLKDIRSFSSLLFEYKKPLKKLFVSMLNEKYGISVQNLKDIPTFKSLLNTQVLIFEALSKLSPKGSLQKEVLLETAHFLKSKNGVESIDVNYFIELLFEKAEYTNILDKEPIINSVSLKETFSEIESIEELVDVILERKYRGEAERKEKAKRRALRLGLAVKGEKDKEEENKDSENSETDLGDDPRLEEKARPKKDPHQEVDDVAAAHRRANQTADDATNQREVDRLKAQEELDKKRKKRTEKRRTTGGGDVQQYGAEHAETELEDSPRMDEQEPPAETEEAEAPEKEGVPTSDEIMSSFKNFEDILNSINFEDPSDEDEEEEEKEKEEATEKEAEVDKKEEGEE